MQLDLNHKKNFDFILSRSGAGKTFLMYLLIYKHRRPSIVLDNHYQFKTELTFKNLDEFLDYMQHDKLNDFIIYKKKAVLRLNEDEKETFFKLMNNSIKYKNFLICIDELEIFLEKNRLSNSSNFFKFLNTARHKNYYLITTSKRIASIPKNIINEADNIFISDLIDKHSLKYLNETFYTFKNLLNEISKLKKYQFLRIYVNDKKIKKFKTKEKHYKLFC
jgi:hypothetical protein